MVENRVNLTTGTIILGHRSFQYNSRKNVPKKDFFITGQLGKKIDKLSPLSLELLLHNQVQKNF